MLINLKAMEQAIKMPKVNELGRTARMASTAKQKGAYSGMVLALFSESKYTAKAWKSSSDYFQFLQVAQNSEQPGSQMSQNMCHRVQYIYMSSL